jgi:hypothetical protein
MTMRDTAIIAYAETKIVAKGDKDVWTLGAEVLEDLIRTTGVDKAEIDGLILSSSQTGAGNPFWAQTTADQLALEVDFCNTVDIGGCSPVGAVARIERDRVAGFVDLETVAVELDLIDPPLALGQALMQDRLAGDDEGGARHARTGAEIYY